MCIKNRTATLWILTETKDKYYPSQQIKSLDIILPDNNVTIHHSRYYTLIYRTQQKRPPHKKSEVSQENKRVKKRAAPYESKHIKKACRQSGEQASAWAIYVSPNPPDSPQTPRTPLFPALKQPRRHRGSASNVKFALKFKFFSRNIWSVRKNCLPLHSLFGGSPHRKAPRAEARRYPPKFFSKKNLVDSKTRRNFANAFGLKKPGRWREHWKTYNRQE